MHVSVEILATSEMDGETQSWGIEMRDVLPSALGRPAVAMPDRTPITEMQPIPVPPGALGALLGAWSGRAAGYRDVRVMLWKLADD